MAYQQKNMTGSLFRNDKKETDAHPNATGSCLIDGVAYWVSAWTKEGANGKWQSLAFTRKEQKPEPASKKQRAPDDDTDLPF